MNARLRFSDLPLREQKAARTRVGLVEALTARLCSQPLDTILIRDLAADAHISEATFFNYFPTKSELLTYFIQLWSLDVAAVAEHAYRARQSARAAVAAVFEHTAREAEAHPSVMLETIAHQARMPSDLQPAPVDRAVRLLRLTDAPDPLTVPDAGLAAVLRPLLQRARKQGELPRRADIDQVLLALASVFFGVPLLLARQQPQLIGRAYQAQLELVWAGARALNET